MPLQTLVVFLLGAAAAGGLLWVFLYPLLSGERQAEKRQASVARPERASRAASARGATKSRREQVEESLKELEFRKKRSRNPALPLRLAQAGLSWSPRQFYLISATLGLCVIGGALLVGGGLPASVVLGLVAGFGLPRWILGFLKKRRERRFLNVFPDAVDVIVRGMKAGLPLGDCLKIIANEAQEPVKSEFRSIVETQAIGMPVGEACLKLYESVPLPEPNFLRHRGLDPAEIRRQPFRGARQSVACAARPQAHAGQDPGDVDGGQGVGGDHRRAAAGGDAARVHHQPELHRASVDGAGWPHDARGLRHVDDDGRIRHEEDDQFRFLMWRHDRIPARENVGCAVPGHAVRCRRRGRDGADAGDAAARPRRPPSPAQGCGNRPSNT